MKCLDEIRKEPTHKKIKEKFQFIGKEIYYPVKDKSLGSFHNYEDSWLLGDSDKQKYKKPLLNLVCANNESNNDYY